MRLVEPQNKKGNAKLKLQSMNTSISWYTGPRLRDAQ